MEGTELILMHYYYLKSTGFTLGVLPPLDLEKSMMSHIHPYRVTQNSFIALKIAGGWSFY